MKTKKKGIFIYCGTLVANKQDERYQPQKNERKRITRRAVHFGAGSIGRGFIGERLHAPGYEIAFTDVNEDLINMIDEEQGYELQLINHDLQLLYIDHVRTLSTPGDKGKLLWELAHCDLITTSVWPNNLPKIALLFCIFQAEY